MTQPLPAHTGEKASDDSLEHYAHQLQVALTGLTRQGSEFFVRHGHGYRADVMACVQDVRRRQEASDRRAMKALKDRKVLLDALQTAQAVLNEFRTPDMKVSSGDVYLRVADAEFKARSAILAATGGEGS